MLLNAYIITIFKRTEIEYFSNIIQNYMFKGKENTIGRTNYDQGSSNL